MQPSDAEPRWPRETRLTKREIEVLTLLALGRTAAEVGEALSISQSRVGSIKGRLYVKLGANNRLGALRAAMLLGLVPHDPDLG